MAGVVSDLIIALVKILVLARLQYNKDLAIKVESRCHFIDKRIIMNNIVGLLIFSALRVVNNMKALVRWVVMNVIIMI